MKTITAIDLRKKLGGILNDVSNKKEHVIISRANKPLAVLVSISEYEEKILKKNREEKLHQLATKMEVWRKKHRKQTVNVDIVKAVREMREEKW